MRLQLVASGSANGATGLSRYSNVLYSQLLRAGVNVQLTQPKVPLGWLLDAAGRRLNLDPNTFFSNYPVRIENRQADVYHLAAENLASVLMFQRIRPVVVTVHAFFTYFLRNEPNLAMYNHTTHRVFDSLAAKGLHRADAIIAVSNYVAELLINELGISPERVYVIYEAVDHDVFRPLEVPETFREKYRLDPDRFYFLYVGSEQPRKNFLMLLRAFARVRAKHNGVRLLKIGAPEFPAERARAITLANQLGIADDVIFLGHVGDELPLFYNASDVFVFPSLYEGFGFPPLEAMACGTPTICSNATSLPEVVGEGACLFSPDDEAGLVALMRKMISEPDLRAAIRERGLEQVKRFSWETNVIRTNEVYTRCLTSY